MRQITCLKRDDPFAEVIAATPFGEGKTLPKVIITFSFCFSHIIPRANQKDFFFQDHVILTFYPPITAGKATTETDDPEVTSEAENPAEDASDGEEEASSPHKVSEEPSQKRVRESVEESEGAEKENPNSVPVTATAGTCQTHASRSSTPWRIWLCWTRFRWRIDHLLLRLKSLGYRLAGIFTTLP